MAGFLLGIGKGEAAREFNGLRHGSRRGPAPVRDEPRPGAGGPQDRRAAASGRAGHHDPPGATQRLPRPDPDGGRLAAVARPRRRHRPAVAADHPSRLGGGGRAGRAAPRALHRRHSATRPALRAAHLRLLRPRCRAGRRARHAVRTRVPGEADQPLRSGRQARTTCAGSPRRRSGARPTRSSRSARHAARTIGTDHIAFAFRYAGVPYAEAEASMRLFASEVLPACSGSRCRHEHRRADRARLQLGPVRPRRRARHGQPTSRPRSGSPRRASSRPARCSRWPSTSSPTRRR